LIDSARLPGALLLAALALLAGNTAHAEQKVLRFAFRSVETGFDPQRVDDLYSSAVNNEIFEPLLEFDYFARPVRLAPLAAESVPEPEEGGSVYTFRIRRGVYFSDDPAFRGQRRELTARDAAYAIKRLRDPRNRAPYGWLVQDALVGLDELHDEALESGRFDYDRPIAGIEVVDRYTLRLRLKQPDYNFLYRFTMPQTAPVAREVIETYAEDTMAHPVGTGPFRLAEWTRRQKIVLERNPSYRGRTLDTTWADPGDPEHRRVIADLRGKLLPQLDRVEIYPMDASQPRFLAFMNGEHDLIQEVPVTFINQVAPGGRLLPSLEARGIRMQRVVPPEITYYSFNMEHPVIGGYTPEKVALRRALVLAHDVDSEIAVLYKGQGQLAYGPVPPGVVGYDPDFRHHEQDYDPARAVALLDLYGWVDHDGDGWRDRPDGQPLVIDYLHSTGATAREAAGLWEKSMRRIGIRLVARGVQFSDQLRDRKAGKYMIAAAAWAADWPDAQNFLALLYGPNAPELNDNRFRLEAYDRLYERAAMMPDSPERNRLYREMSRLAIAYAPWRLSEYLVWTHLSYPWVLGYLKHPIYHTRLEYLDVDVATRAAAQAR
jgi:oligopeptide transport system substrate-binding protein